ncbi:hypothetical protein C8R45DRAFT_1223162 [Mycena sanguinolenta]|nr:hypothetical protein C8R45DRAFT_1223162 [Mycena sanguinolenta]
MKFFALTAAFFSLAAMPQLLAASPLHGNTVQGYAGHGYSTQDGLCDPWSVHPTALCCKIDNGNFHDCNPPPREMPLDMWEWQCGIVGKTPACCTPLAAFGFFCHAA